MNPLVATGAAIDGVLARLLPPPARSDERESSAPPLARCRRARTADAARAARDPPARLLARRHRGAGSDGPARRHNRCRALDPVVGGRRPRAKLAACSPPVYDDTLDQVIGILYAKDLLAAVIADEEPAGRVGFARAPRLVHSRKQGDRLRSCATSSRRARTSRSSSTSTAALPGCSPSRTFSKRSSATSATRTIGRNRRSWPRRTCASGYRDA